jgi:two-component sensor histidine kinase
MESRVRRRVKREAWFHRYPRGLPVALFLLMALLTMATVGMLESNERDQRALMLERNATEVSSALQQREAEHLAYLRAAAALITRQRGVDAAMIEGFHRDLGDNLAQLGALGLGWVEVVPADQRAAIEARQRARGYPDFRIWPAPDPASSTAMAVLYLFPRNHINARAIGFDMATEPLRRDALERAARLRRPVATGRVQLIQDGDGDPTPGFLIYMPVFDPATGALRGQVYSPFRASEFLASANRLHVTRRIGVALYDGPELDPAHLLAEDGLDGPAGSRLVKRIMFGERRWTLVVSEPEQAALSTLSRVTLLSGLLMAMLMLVIAQLVTRRAAEDHQILEWESRQSEIRNTLTRELNHRVKNTLANVLSIIALTRRRSDSLDGFADSLTGRIRALSATHDLLTRSEWAPTPIREVIEAELSPYLAMEGGNLVIAGPPVSLAPSEALSLGLALHELATNAAKYGSLSLPTGKVAIHWRLTGSDAVELHWSESGGPAVTAPDKRGFGRELIERVVAHELKQPVELRFDAGGVQCRLRVPVRQQTSFTLRNRPAKPPASA